MEKLCVYNNRVFCLSSSEPFSPASESIPLISMSAVPEKTLNIHLHKIAYS